jgi:hypothetical protein
VSHFVSTAAASRVVVPITPRSSVSLSFRLDLLWDVPVLC